MKTYLFLFAAAAMVAAGCQKASPTAQPEAFITNQHATAMIISSPNFSGGGEIPKRFTCSGKGDSPALSIEEVPTDAQSLALIMEDPDAPAGTFVHWVMWGIHPGVRQVDENGLPDGAVQGLNSAGKNGYVAPCPPSGTHRYIFRVYALDNKLSPSESTTGPALQQAMQNHILAQAELVGMVTHE